MNAVIKYPGAKWSLAPWIVSHLPPHHSYLEPFFGSGAVLFTKSRSNIETVNDLDSDVVNLFECIRRDPERLGWIIQYTPYSRQEFEKTYSSDIPADPFDRAARFLIRCNQGYGFRTNEIRVGWKNDVQGRERAYAAKSWTELPKVIAEVAERLRGVQIEHDEGGPCWTFATTIPHETFTIFEDGEPFCEGIVFSMEHLKGEAHER